MLLERDMKYLLTQSEGKMKFENIQFNLELKPLSSFYMVVNANEFVFRLQRLICTMGNLMENNYLDMYGKFKCEF